MKRIATITVLGVAAVTLMGLNGSYGHLTWTFLLGDYAANYTAQGVPNNLDPASRAILDDDFWIRLSNAMPERRALKDSVAPSIVTDDTSKLALTQDAEVFVTFINESAGYKNSLGFYTYDPADAPADKWDIDETIIFPNMSISGDSGLHAGDIVSLGEFTAGTRLGFAIAANGWDAAKGVKSNLSTSKAYYTEPKFNSEYNAKYRSHAIYLYDSPTDSLIVGMEDLPRFPIKKSDHDFNDATFVLSTWPVGALDVSNIMEVPAQKTLDLTSKSIDVVLVADNSGSEWDHLDKIQEASQLFVNALLSDAQYANRVGITRVSTCATILQELTPDTVELTAAVDSMDSNKGWTALYDGIRLANEVLAAAVAAKMPIQDPTWRAIVVFTDGQENNSAGEHTPDIVCDSIDTTFADLLVLDVNYVPTPIFTVGIGDGVDAAALQQLADDTGGFYRSVANIADLPAALLGEANLVKSLVPLSFDVSAPGASAAKVLVNVTLPSGEVVTDTFTIGID